MGVNDRNGGSLVRLWVWVVLRLHEAFPAKTGRTDGQVSDDDAVQIFISTDAGGVGLNLQSATVLINLDMPWNPAVLDQRIARIPGWAKNRMYRFSVAGRRLL